MYKDVFKISLNVSYKEIVYSFSRQNNPKVEEHNSTNCLVSLFKIQNKCLLQQTPQSSVLNNHIGTLKRIFFLII